MGIFGVLNLQIFVRVISLNEKAQPGAEVGTKISALIDQIIWWPLAFLVVSFVIGIWYGVVEFRYLINNLKLRNVALKSSISAAFVYRVYVLFWAGVIALLVGFLVSLSGVSFAVGGGAVGLQFLMFVGAVFLYFLFGAAKTLFIDVTLLKRACATLEIENSEELADVIQSSADLPGHGEGLADALDVGGF